MADAPNGNGKLWKVAGLIAVPAYGLLAWALLSTVDNRSTLARHDEKFTDLTATITSAKLEVAKDILGVQRDFTNLKVDFGALQQNMSTNQNKIETKIDTVTKLINDMQLQLAGSGINGHSKR